MTDSTNPTDPAREGDIPDRDEADASLWQQARTLADLGELTARWLEGSVRWLPLYYGAGPDPETDELIEPLAEMNRLGLWTNMSQPGVIANGWRQRANVSGYCDTATANALAAGLIDTDLLLIALPAPLAEDCAVQIPITCDGAAECSWVGAHDPLSQWATELPAAAMDALISSDTWAIDVVDLTWGRNDLLWATVLTALRQRPQRVWSDHMRHVFDQLPANSRYDSD